MRTEKLILYRFFFLMLALMITGLAGCQATNDSSSSGAGTSQNEPAASPAAKSVTTTATTAPASDAPPVASAHGSVGQTAAAAPPPTTASANNSADKPEIDTSKLDAKIAKAEAKAKAMGASDAERRAAAEAYFERGYVYYSAQNPRLYKFALGDFRRVVQYHPAHKEARDIIAQIEAIYRSMGRPVPTNGLEP
jgi:hypothetical protein